MTPFLRKLLGMNWLLLALMLALAIFGVIAIYSATYMRTDPGVAGFWRRQLVWVVLGLVGFLGVSLVDYRWVKWGALPIYLSSIAFLILTRIIGKKVYGARSWLEIGPINFQPAQLAVIGGILVMALLLTQFRSLPPLLKIAMVGGIAGGPMVLILIQPDLGETIVWGPVILAMLFVAAIPLRYLICIILLVIIAMPLAFNFGLHDYQQGRITAFMHPEVDPKGDAWAINQSLIAIGSGGWGGKGFKAPNTQVELGFLPSTAVHNDYIFSVIGEEWGFVGGVVLLSAFALLLLLCLFTAFHAADELGMLIVTGVAALIFFHIYQNIGMTIALMPITGLPLPLISYSGSFAVIVMISLGLVNSVWVHRKSLAAM